MKTKTKGKLVKGIDKRIHKDGTVSYRARLLFKGHPVIIQSFSSKTLAMKWKRDTASAIERGILHMQWTILNLTDLVNKT